MNNSTTALRGEKNYAKTTKSFENNRKAPNKTVEEGQQQTPIPKEAEDKKFTSINKSRTNKTSQKSPSITSPKSSSQNTY